MRLSLCGSVQLTRDEDGAAIAMAAKSLALLSFLTLEPGSHSRNELSGLLWGDSEEDKAHASLRQTLKQLREVVGAHLQVDRFAVSISTPIPCDVTEFLALIDGDGPFPTEIDIPRFLQGLVVRDADLFNEWSDRTRQSLMQQYRRSLIAAARAALARRDWSRAITLAERWQRIDELSDDAAHFHVEALFLSGARDAALAVYRDFTAVRDRESGAKPGLALRELAARIEHAPSRPTPSRTPSLRAVQLPSFDGALIGRDQEWQSLSRAWRAAQQGRGGVVYIEGVAGVGKTRLLDDLARLASTQSGTVLRARAFESGLEVPFGSFREILRSAIDAPGVSGTDGEWLAEVARVVPELRRQFPALPEPSRAPTANGSLVHEGIAQMLLAIAEESPLLMLVDDLQWSDSDSCHLMHFLMQRLHEAQVLWCVAYTQGAVDRDAPAARLARVMRSVAHDARLSLSPLSGDEVWRFIHSMGHLSGPDSARRLAARVFDVTGGNPLYVVELLKTLFTRGWLSIHPETNEWISTGEGAEALLASELFPDVREAIAERVAALPDEQHALLLTVAATGSGCHTSLLSYVHGISRLRAAHVCDALADRHLVTEADGHYLCAHQLIADVVLSATSASRRREIHRMIALALTEAAASVRRAVDTGAIARHAEAGGERALAHTNALLASRACAETAAWDDALAWLDLASSCAESNEERRAADEATAALLGRAGWAAAPLRSAVRMEAVAIGRSDVDLHAMPAAR